VKIHLVPRSTSTPTQDGGNRPEMGGRGGTWTVSNGRKELESLDFETTPKIALFAKNLLHSHKNWLHSQKKIGFIRKQMCFIVKIIASCAIFLGSFAKNWLHSQKICFILQKCASFVIFLGSFAKNLLHSDFFLLHLKKNGFI